MYIVKVYASDLFCHVVHQVTTERNTDSTDCKFSPFQL